MRAQRCAAPRARHPRRPRKRRLVAQRARRPIRFQLRAAPRGSRAQRRAARRLDAAGITACPTASSCSTTRWPRGFPRSRTPPRARSRTRRFRTRSSARSTRSVPRLGSMRVGAHSSVSRVARGRIERPRVRAQAAPRARGPRRLRRDPRGDSRRAHVAHRSAGPTSVAPATDPLRADASRACAHLPGSRRGTCSPGALHPSSAERRAISTSSASTTITATSSRWARNGGCTGIFAISAGCRFARCCTKSPHAMRARC